MGFRGVRDTAEWLNTVPNGSDEGRLLPIAHDYTSSLAWMRKTFGFWHGITIGSLVGVFLYRIEPNNPDIPEYHCIVVGPKWPYPIWDEHRIDQNAIANSTYSGLPYAFIWAGDPPDFPDPDSSPNAACALDSYVGVIQDWIDAVKSGADLNDVFPVDVP